MDGLFKLIGQVQYATGTRLGTGVLNRVLREAFAANPPATVANQRLKLFYAAQARGEETKALPTPEFVLFVNNPQLLGETYARYLEAKIREIKPFTGLPLMLNFHHARRRQGKNAR